MHNFVLEADGLNEQWDNGVPSDWEGDLGRHSPRDVNTFLPPALSRALRPDQMSEYDTSGMGPGNDRPTWMLNQIQTWETILLLAIKQLELCDT
jgi:hypothetical protein